MGVADRPCEGGHPTRSDEANELLAGEARAIGELKAGDAVSERPAVAEVQHAIELDLITGGAVGQEDVP